MRSVGGSSRAQRESRWPVAASVARILVTTGVLVALYVLMPLEAPANGSAAVRLGLSVLLLVVVVSWQIVIVARSPYPRLRAVEAVSISFPLLIFLFASTYYAMDQAIPESFNEPISRIDAIYLTVTIFSTVGFGDLVATTEPARVAVTIQMIVNMALIGVVAKVLLGTVQHRQAMLGVIRPAAGDPPRDTSD